MLLKKNCTKYNRTTKSNIKFTFYLTHKGFIYNQISSFTAVNQLCCFWISSFTNNFPIRGFCKYNSIIKYHIVIHIIIKKNILINTKLCLAYLEPLIHAKCFPFGLNIINLQAGDVSVGKFGTRLKGAIP